MTKLIRRLANYDDPTSFGSRMRARRARRVVALIDEIHAATGGCRILDLGGTETYWDVVDHEFLKSRKVTITLLNLSEVRLTDNSGLFVAAAGNACDLSEFADASMDLVHSNSVIEHVGQWPQMKAMATEMRRVGVAYYLQTPYYWFPIEPHYFGVMLHWLPFPWRVKIATRMSLGNWPRARSVDEAVMAQQSAQLLDETMLRALFPDARICAERWFGLTKSLIAIRDLRWRQESGARAERS